VHGRLAIMEWRGRSKAGEVIVIAQRERERERERRSTGLSPMAPLGDGHTTTLNTDDWWCSDGEIVLGTRMRDWSRVGALDNGSALVAPFMGP
jgi:hypothetical protein